MALLPAAGGEKVAEGRMRGRENAYRWGLPHPALRATLSPEKGHKSDAAGEAEQKKAPARRPGLFASCDAFDD